MSLALPTALIVAKAAKLPVFGSPYDPNLIAIRDRTQPLDIFDGSLTLAWALPAGGWEAITAVAATRPGTAYLTDDERHQDGTAMLVAAHRNVLSHALGVHGEDKTPCFRQVAPVLVWRDDDGDHTWDPPLVEGTPSTFTNASGVNVHECSNPKYLAGCVGVPRLQLAPILQAYREILALRSNHMGKPAVDRVSLSMVDRPIWLLR